MKYRILLTASNRGNNSIYKYYTEGSGTSSVIYETENVADLDRKVEELLETYNKSDINIVSPVDYVIDAIIDVSDIYVNSITGNLVGGVLTYTMTGSNLFSNENYQWIMTYDNDLVEVSAVGLSRTASPDEVIRYNSATSVKAKIKKDNYISEEFTIK